LLTTWLEIVQALMTKYKDRPVIEGRVSRSARYTNLPNQLAEAGSSSGPGTLAQADIDGS
jgi:hypothetical protein